MRKVAEYSVAVLVALAVLTSIAPLTQRAVASLNAASAELAGAR